MQLRCTGCIKLKKKKTLGSTWSLNLLKMGFNLKLRIMPVTILYHAFNISLSLVLFGQVKKTHPTCFAALTWLDFVLLQCLGQISGIRLNKYWKNCT